MYQTHSLKKKNKEESEFWNEGTESHVYALKIKWGPKGSNDAKLLEMTKETRANHSTSMLNCLLALSSII